MSERNIAEAVKQKYGEAASQVLRKVKRDDDSKTDLP